MVVNKKSSNALFRREYWENFWSNNNDIDDTSKYKLLLRTDYRNKNIMELGCGDLSQSSEIISNSRTYKGIDISKNALNLAVLSENFSNKTKLICSDILNLPIKNEIIESVISIDTLSSLGPDFNYGFKRILQTMTKNGVINFNITHTDWFMSGFDYNGGNSSIINVLNGTVFKCGQKEVFTSTPNNISIGLYQMGLKPLKVNVISAFRDPYFPQSTPMSIMIRGIKK